MIDFSLCDSDDYPEYRDGADEGLGIAVSASWVSATLNKVLADQQARIGRFLTYKQKLLELKSRAQSIRSVDNQSGTVLVGRVDALLQNQTAYESQGLSVIQQANTFMANPLVKAVVGSPDFTSQASSEMTLRLGDLINQINNLYKNSSALSVNFDAHEGAITDVQRAIVSKENDLTGRGIFRQIQKPATDLMSTVKWVAIAGAVIFGATVIMKAQGRKS